MPAVFGFNLDDVVDPRAKTDFAQFISALQQFANSFTLKDEPFTSINLYGIGGVVLVVNGVLNTNQFRVVGDVMEWSFSYLYVAVGVGVSSIAVRLPSGYKVAPGIISTAGWMYDNGTGTPTLIQASSGDEFVSVSRSDLAALGNTGGAYTTQVRGQIRLKVLPPT